MPGGVLSLVLAGAALAPLVQGGAVQPPWQLVGLPQQTTPLTQFGAEVMQGREAVRVQAAGSYGNLVHGWPAEAATPRRMRWSWRLQQANAQVDLRQKAGDDTPVKVCLGFEMPLERVPFLDRQILQLARTRTQQPLPAATLCWVWGGAEAKGAMIVNAFSARVRYIVLRNAQDATGTWFEEDRDIAADFRRTFGDESPELPPLSAVIVGGDADNTGNHSVAHVAALRTEP
jgi:hypothetical protein